MALALVLTLSLAFPSAHAAQVICEHLKENECAFAVSSASKRCILENTPQGGYQCKTSDVAVEKISNHIETYACLGACGLERNTVGISSDAFLESSSMAKLCSPGCSNNCPNIVDLYTNLASGEGASLSDLCEKQSASPHRQVAEISNSGAAAGPASDDGEAGGNPHHKMEEVSSPAAAPGPASAGMTMQTLKIKAEAPSPSA